MSVQRSQPYRHFDTALIRATAHGTELDLPPWPEPDVPPPPQPYVAPRPEPDVPPLPQPYVAPRPEPDVPPLPQPYVAPRPEPDVPHVPLSRELDDEAAVERWCEWLVQVWARESVAAAVSLASPVLAAQIEAVCAGRRPRPGRLRRMALSLARYLVRMRGRATPFGTFAGVAPLRFGAAPEYLAGAPRTRTTADGVWLAAVIARLESDPELRHRLPVMVNDLAFVRGERLVVPWQPHAGDPARSELTEVSVRRSAAVRTVMELAQAPVRAGDLVDGLAVTFPAARVPAIEAMVAELVTCGVLITSLRPPSTSVDGLAYVLDRLRDTAADWPGDATPQGQVRKADPQDQAQETVPQDQAQEVPQDQAQEVPQDQVEAVPQGRLREAVSQDQVQEAALLGRESEVSSLGRGLEVAGLVRELRAIHVGLRAADRATGATGEAAVRARRAVGERMRDVVPVEVAQPLAVDLRLGGTAVLPREVAAEAESAAGALWRLTPDPSGHPAWREYHVMFLDRYGVGGVVPIEQLADPTAGLGFPGHYDGPAVPAPLSRRDQRLLALAQQAALDGEREIVLDDAAIEALAADGMDGARPLPYMELVAEVCAPTADALTAGAFTLTVLAVDGTAAGLAGRFTDLLQDGDGQDGDPRDGLPRDRDRDQQDSDRQASDRQDSDRRPMVGVYSRLPVAVDGAVPVQLSFPARHPRAQDVARTPPLLPELITLAEHRAGPHGRIPWRDLAVTADNDRMYLLSPSRRQVVEPVLSSAVARHAMPPIARLLFEIPRARAAVVSPFSWGAAACLPFLPRIRYGRSVLAPARWRISTDVLPGPDTPWPEWVRAMTALRARLRLPAVVSVGTADRRLRLDLDEPMSLALLRAHLAGAGEAVVVSEATGPADHGWFGRRAHEVVISMAATAPPARAPAAVTVPGPLPLVGREDGVLPGARVLYAKLYGDPGVVDTILTKHLPDLLETWDEPPMWWFVRYRDPRPHLRLRLHLAGEHDYGPSAARVGAWAAELRGRGLVGDLVLDTYHPETARYGAGEVLAGAEAVFAADSVAVVAQLAALSATRHVHPHALTAASLVDLTAALMRGQAAGARWQIEHPLTGHAAPNDREVVRQAVGLADPSGGWAAPAALPGGDRAAPAALPGGDRATLAALPGGWRIVRAWEHRRRAVDAYLDRLPLGAPRLTESSVVASLLHMHHIRALGIDRDAERRCRKLARAVALTFAARDGTPPGTGD
ncbi:thiopeptide-type bacteriocin biosynthesis protein [Nonomuraea sp. NPDC049129]|uniref:thiopeptide-type bacteriocin biosynthesis protein n=1 Tax=Nonomuraea sp. NPDC049129 TaxID=3155272 RepID=UPI0033E3A9BA